MIAFVHAADLHLDSPFVGVAEMDEGVAEVVRHSTFQAYDNLIDLCLRESVDFLLVAGDVYDGADRSLKAQLAFRDGLARLSDSGIRSFVVHGNHDPLDGWASSLEWPEDVHIFGGRRVESVMYHRDGVARCLVHGISFSHREVRTNLARQFRVSDIPVPQVGLLHCNVGDATGHAGYAPCRFSDLDPEMTYWALGHVHTRRILSRERPTVVYPGNPQGLNIKESGPRGCMLGKISDDGAVDIGFVPVDAVRWRRESIPLDKIDSEEGLLSLIEGAVNTVQAGSDGRPCICRLTLEGRSALHPTLKKAGYLEDLLGHAREMGRDLSPFVWIDRIDCRTRSVMDIQARRRSQDFVGDLLRIADAWRGDPTGLGGEQAGLAELYEHRRCRKWLHMPTEDDLLALLDEAENECLDRLLEEDGS